MEFPGKNFIQDFYKGLFALPCGFGEQFFSCLLVYQLILPADEPLLL